MGQNGTKNEGFVIESQQQQKTMKQEKQIIEIRRRITGILISLALMIVLMTAALTGTAGMAFARKKKNSR